MAHYFICVCKFIIRMSYFELFSSSPLKIQMGPLFFFSPCPRTNLEPPLLNGVVEGEVYEKRHVRKGGLTKGTRHAYGFVS